MRMVKMQGKGWWGGIADPFDADNEALSTKPRLPGEPLNIGSVLKSGVYVLVWRNDVVYVARSHCMLMALAAHRTASNGPALPDWFPIKGIQYEDAYIYPLAWDRTESLMQELIATYKPRYNERTPSPPNPFLRPLPKLERRI